MFPDARLFILIYFERTVFFLDSWRAWCMSCMWQWVSGLLFLLVYVRVLFMIQSPHILLCQTEKRAKIGIADVKFILHISLFQVFLMLLWLFYFVSRLWKNWSKFKRFWGYIARPVLPSVLHFGYYFHSVILLVTCICAFVILCYTLFTLSGFRPAGRFR